MKAAGINLKQVERLIAIANNDLPSVEKTYESVRIRVAELHGDIRNSAFTFQSLSDGISSMNETFRSLEAKKQKEEEEISKLYQKRMKLQGFVRYFVNSDERYLSIAKFAEEKVHGVLSQNKLFLQLAVQSLIELIASDPTKYGFSIDSFREKHSFN
jgi:chromosome segregation ATPase